MAGDRGGSGGGRGHVGGWGLGGSWVGGWVGEDEGAR